MANPPALPRRSKKLVTLLIDDISVRSVSAGSGTQRQKERLRRLNLLQRASSGRPL